jgi:hypothetical protein
LDPCGIPWTRSAAEGKQASEFDDSYSHDPNEAEFMPERDSGGWKPRASAHRGVAIAGVSLPAMVCGAAILSEAILVMAIVGALLTPGPPPPTIEAVLGSINVHAPSDETVATPDDAGATLLKESTQPAQVKVVRSEEQSIDLAQALGDLSAAEALVPAAADAAQATAGLSSETPAAAPINTPVVIAPVATPPPAASEFPDAQTMRAVPPDGKVATLPPSATASGEAAQAGDVARPPANPAPEAATETAGTAQASTPNLDSPARLPGKPSAGVVLARIDTTAPNATMETPSQHVQLGAPVKSEKAKIALEAPQAAVEPQAAQPAPRTSTQPPVSPLARAFAELVGALAAPAGWAVQLAAPRSEAEAKSDVARLDAKYASLLNGAAIAVQKAEVKGATVYRLRVLGLFKAEAGALCARVKDEGGDCFITKATASSPSKGGRGLALPFDADPRETRPSLSGE